MQNALCAPGKAGNSDRAIGLVEGEGCRWSEVKSSLNILLMRVGLGTNILTAYLS